jgi:hypothetical protein
MPVMAPDLKAMSGRLQDLCAACAVRTLARTETFMPMKPATPDSTAPIRKPTANGAEKNQAEHEDDDADDGDGACTGAQIGLRAFLDGGGDFLHWLQQANDPRRQRTAVAPSCIQRLSGHSNPDQC